MDANIKFNDDTEKREDSASLTPSALLESEQTGPGWQTLLRQLFCSFVHIALLLV